jgi:hypothetical protein
MFAKNTWRQHKKPESQRTMISEQIKLSDIESIPAALSNSLQ